MQQPMSQRGNTVCRACEGSPLEDVLDLGEQPLPAEYGRTADEVMDAFPLRLRICPRCCLGQLGEYVFPERIFHKNYPYLSSASSTWVEHARKFANTAKGSLQLGADSLVLEVASNDGYMLGAFQKLGIPVLGVEPCANVAAMAVGAGIPTISEFFGARLADQILKKHGHPRLIAANNVFAHVPDMHDFMLGLSKLAGANTLITIENPSFPLLLQDTLFDTIYHEHYSYLSAHSVGAIAKTHGLTLMRVEQLPTHGGSNRYWLARAVEPEASVEASMDAEIRSGLFSREHWDSFAFRANRAINGLRDWLVQRRAAGDVVVGYGAAHKGNTFLNAVGPLSKTLAYVVDASSEKQGKFLPGSRVSVLSPDQLASGNPTDVLILPWNIASEISSRIRCLVPNARIWVAQPEVRRL